MVDLDAAYGEMRDDIDSVTQWSDEIYNKDFSDHFKGQRDLYKRLQSKSRPVTDEELEWILTSLPLDMFSVSEKLAQLKLSLEVIRMKNKEEMSKRKSNSTATTLTERRESAELEILERKLVDTVYNSVIDRVEREVSFTRELIMSAKKIWDRRRATEESNPINPVDLSSVVPQGHKTYYEQMQAAKGQPIYG